MTTEAQKAACRRYYAKKKKVVKAYLFRLNRESDADVISVLDSKANKTDYLRKLVRNDMEV